MTLASRAGCMDTVYRAEGRYSSAVARLLTVEEAFAGDGRGVTLVPKITVKDAPAGPIRVRLRLPGGAEREATATFQVAHIRGPHGAFAMVKLADLAPEEVPVGTEV